MLSGRLASTLLETFRMPLGDKPSDPCDKHFALLLGLNLLDRNPLGFCRPLFSRSVSYIHEFGSREAVVEWAALAGGSCSLSPRNFAFERCSKEGPLPGLNWRLPSVFTSKRGVKVAPGVTSLYPKVYGVYIFSRLHVALLFRTSA